MALTIENAADGATSSGVSHARMIGLAGSRNVVETATAEWRLRRFPADHGITFTDVGICGDQNIADPRRLPATMPV